MYTRRLRVYLLNVIFWATLFRSAPAWYRWLTPVLILILLIPEILLLTDDKKKAASAPALENAPTWLLFLISLITVLLLIYFLSQLSGMTLIFKLIVLACTSIILFFEFTEWRERLK